MFFCIDPEKVHHTVVWFLKLGFNIPGMNWLAKKITNVDDPKLERELFGLRFKNPVGIAAGFDKNAFVYQELGALGFSHIEIGTVTPKGQPGNPKPRLFRLAKDKGLINRMGFNNLGLEMAVKRLRKRDKNLIIGGNIGKNTATPNDEALADYLTNFEGLLSMSCDYSFAPVHCCQAVAI